MKDSNGSGPTAGSLADLAELAEPTSRAADKLYRTDAFTEGTGTERGGFGLGSRPAMGLVGEPRRQAARVARQKTTLEYPLQGKLLDPLDPLEPTRELREGEPAEPLFVAIVVGAAELNSGVLRSRFASGRTVPHTAMVYHWRGSFTFDVIGFDAIDEEAGRHSGHVDLLLLSDQLFGATLEGEVIRSLEKAALEARLKFPRSYLVGLSQDTDAAWLDGHPFNSVEAKAGARNMAVFDQRLMGEITSEVVGELLLTYARSDRYAADRNVWTVPEDGSPAVPAPKGFVEDSLL